MHQIIYNSRSTADQFLSCGNMKWGKVWVRECNHDSLSVKQADSRVPEESVFCSYSWGFGPTYQENALDIYLLGKLRVLKYYYSFREF